MTAENTWSHPLYVEGLHVINLSEIQEGFIVVTCSEQVADHSSNPFSSRLAFTFCCGSLFFDGSCQDFHESACNL